MGKKQKCPEFENHERWLVSFADMVTLLFAVFVVLFALKEGGEPQTQSTAGSMQESFNTPLDDIPLDRLNGPSEHGFGIFEHFRGDQVEPEMINKLPSTKKRVTIIAEEMNKANMELEERLYGPNKYPDKKTTGHERIVQVSPTDKGFKIQLLARHFFKSGDINVRSEARKDLDQVIKVLKSLGRDVTVEGHTDSIPPAGKMSNWDLSALRATHVIKYMITKHYFPQTRLSAAGYADVRPIAHNGTAAGRKLNRRIEFHVHYDPESAGSP